MESARKYDELKHYIDKKYEENGMIPPSAEEAGNYESLINSSVQNLSDELKKYRMLFNYAADPIFIHNMQGDIFESNSTASAKYGYTVAEFKKMHIWQVDVSGLNEEIQKKIDELKQEGSVIFETIHKSKSGNTFYAEVNARIITWKNQAAVLNISRDISERKKAELGKQKNLKRLKFIIQQLQDGIVVFKKNGNILIWNSGVEKITGIKAKDAINRKLFELQYEVLHGAEKNRDIIRQKFDEIVNMTNPAVYAKPFETVIFHPQKGVRVIQAAVYPIRVSRGKYIFGSVLRDITRNKRVEDQLRELNVTKDKIFSIIAHDLKAPFNSIIGFSDILLEKFDIYDREKIKMIIQYINLAAKPTLAVLENLLGWVNAQSGRLGFQPKYFSLNKLLKEVTELLTTSAKIKNINLKWNPVEDVNVFADYNMMSSVLRNLITNAIKFTQPLGQVTVSSCVKDDILKIVVSDTGVGMDEKKLKTIFHLDKTSTTKGTAGERGSGLGLILCKEFIEKHGGKIMVESIVGEGTQFIVELPLLMVENPVTDTVNNLSPA